MFTSVYGTNYRVLNSCREWCQSNDMRILGRIEEAHSEKQSAGIIIGDFCPRYYIIHVEK